MDEERKERLELTLPVVIAIYCWILPLDCSADTLTALVLWDVSVCLVHDERIMLQLPSNVRPYFICTVTNICFLPLWFISSFARKNFANFLKRLRYVLDSDSGVHSWFTPLTFFLSIANPYDMCRVAKEGTFYVIC